MITDNEKKIIRFLLANFSTDGSINQIAKNCELSPNGAYEILKKFEKRGILLPKKISNLKSYKINFASIEARKTLELVLIQDYPAKVRYRHEDLKAFEKIAKLCIIFGSYLSKKDPNDLDVLFVIKKADYKKYSELLERAKIISPIKIHDIIQTKEDLIKNIKKQDKIIKDVLASGVILWGHDFLIEVVKDVAEKQAW